MFLLPTNLNNKTDQQTRR
ncbi:hypothetical protein SS209_00443 [Salmonella enterica subsp. enterica serovar Senftenberg str. SS209]|nr:hypothetical protein SS209_00443 [Salmonella enterica subsp. enterica serovar Senftenberg str. SS209]